MTACVKSTQIAGTRVALWALLLAFQPISGFAQAPAGPPPAWTGTAGVGVALTSGNSDTMNYNLAFDLTRTPKARNVMKWTGLYLRGDKDSEVIVNRTSLGYKDEFTLSGRTFVFGQLDYLRDEFKLIDYLLAPTAGIGFKLVDTEPTKFSVNLGGGAIWEKNPDSDVRTSGAVTANEQLSTQLTSTATLKHAITGLWKANDFADGLYTFSVGLATQISARTQLSIDLLDTLKNRPPTAATKKNDVALVTAFTAKF
jgi:putative salt-induced outer membrane protein